MHADLEKHEREDLFFSIINQCQEPLNAYERKELDEEVEDWKEGLNEFRSMLPDTPIATNVNSHFLDSGAYSLYEKHKNDPSYFHSHEFMDYLDSYAEFVKHNSAAIDIYANVDVIRNPEMTNATQNYLECVHGLRPVPVIHFPSPMKWLKQYLEQGHKLIGVGGMADSNPKEYEQWLDQVFKHSSNEVRFHGFAVLSVPSLWKYPWKSVDGTSWVKAASYGNMLVPCIGANGNFDFQTRPRIIHVSDKDWDPDEGQKRWVSFLTERLANEYSRKEFSKALSSFYGYRTQANLIYFKEVQTALKTSGRDTTIYFSGGCDFTSNPEIVFGEAANLMLSFWELQREGQASMRFRSIVRNRIEAVNGTTIFKNSPSSHCIGNKRPN